MKDLLVRFVDYNKNLDESKFICGLNVESYDRFITFIENMKGKRITLKNKTYEIMDFAANYGGDSEEDAFCFNIYCSEWFF